MSKELQKKQSKEVGTITWRNRINVDENQLSKAALALLAFNVTKKEERETQDLFEEDQYVYLQVATTTLSEKTKQFKVTLPNPIYQETEWCIFTKDEVAESVKDVVKSNNRKAKVIGITKLKKNYKEYEAKRKLKASYDMFVADNDLHLRLPALLGKKFMESKRYPILVKDINAKNIIQKLDSLTQKSFFSLNGDNCMIRVGKTDQSDTQIKANVLAILKKLNDLIEKDNIKHLSIKLLQSPALPFYNAGPIIPSAGQLISKNIKEGVLQIAPADTNTKLFVTWPKDKPADIDEFRKTFEKFGKLQNVEIPQSKNKKPRNFGFVEFESNEAAKKALEKHKSGDKFTAKLFTSKRKRDDDSDDMMIEDSSPQQEQIEAPSKKQKLIEPAPSKPTPAANTAEKAKGAEKSKAPETPKAAENPKVVATPKASEKPKAVETPKAAEKPKPAEKAKVAETPKAAEKPKAVETPKAAEKAKSTETPKPAEKPKATETPKVAKAAEKAKAAETPKVAEKPKSAETANDAETPKAAEKPKAAATPKATPKKKAAETPKVTEKPKVAETPKTAETPKVAEAPKVTETEKAVETTKAAEKPEVAENNKEANGVPANADEPKATSAGIPKPQFESDKAPATPQENATTTAAAPAQPAQPQTQVQPEAPQTPTKSSEEQNDGETPKKRKKTDVPLSTRVLRSRTPAANKTGESVSTPTK
eukprot:TRINITY_DN1190_c0_g1_i2.p1 TRINITY_DN1190_c0_g1~~TRINITY_DN1190_c0_g1_i2.p1  ORF type:complete len:707 (-),score=247.35 TRINITY_DN1190_c0_g1_i2:53-2173(-)